MDKQFLPTSLNEGKKYYKNFKEFDVVFVTGDPYYDHPLSGMTIIARLLDKKGYKVGIIAQPISDEDYKICGKPKYFFCITSGLLDSMLANYTPMLKQRENILVPERALMVYTQKIKSLFRGSITAIGGVEATIRRFTHFDYK
ncbi:MAG TPA: YgiQ family radical SAM protein, partial [Candidatus Nanoarchaeia archaeon]|nr:YgiQ family radical SAM protein [Candidatus Nanoarchaeia archaeon]